jgi:hypothetical protein
MGNKLVDVDRGVELHGRLLALKEDIGIKFLEIGFILLTLKEGGFYKVINPDMSWEAYLTQPEISISPSHARNLMGIYKKFIVELGVPKEALLGIDQRKLTAIIPVVDSGNVEEKLADARALTRGDLVKSLRGVVDHECQWQVITFERCKICYDEKNRNKTDLG